MERFLIDDFEVMQKTSLSQTIDGLRAIDAKWKSLDDPISELNAIRSGEARNNDGSIRQ